MRARCGLGVDVGARAHEGGIDDIDDSLECVAEVTLELEELRELRFDLRPSLSTWSTLTPCGARRARREARSP